MNEFDPVAAARDEMRGMAEMHKMTHQRVLQTEQALAEAEREHDVALKLDAIAGEWLARLQAKLRAVEAEAEASAAEGVKT